MEFIGLIIKGYEVIGFVAGFLGVFVIAKGLVLATIHMFKKNSYWKVRMLLVEHILLGLDFLIARDIVETLVFKSNTLWIDLGMLVLIVIIRVVFSFFTGKEMQEILKDSRLTKRA